MATGNVNKKSQIKNVRIPHDVLDEMESVKQDGESSSDFILSAMRGEISRRKNEGKSENPLLTSLDALARVEEIGIKASEDIRQLITVAQDELKRRSTSK